MKVKLNNNNEHVMHCHFLGRYCAKFDDDCFESFWGIACVGQTHIHTHCLVYVNLFKSSDFENKKIAVIGAENKQKEVEFYYSLWHENEHQGTDKWKMKHCCKTMAHTYCHSEHNYLLAHTASYIQHNIFDSEKLSQIVVVLLTGFELGSLFS